MSVEVIAKVFTSPLKLTAAQHWTLVILADFADHDGRNAWPSKATIADRSRQDPRTVGRALAEMRKIGLIQVQHEANN